MLKDFLYWMAVAGVPFLLLAMNIIVRINRDDRLISSGGDWLLGLIALDIGMIWTSSDFQKFVVRPDFAAAFIQICLTLLLFSFFSWLFVVIKGEPTLKKYPLRKKIVGNGLKFKVKATYVGCWAAVLGITALHLLPFLWKG